MAISNSVTHDLANEAELRTLIDDVYAQIPADDVFTELEFSIVRAMDFAPSDATAVISAGNAAMGILSQARINATRIAETTDLLATWFGVVSSSDWHQRSALSKRAIRAQLLANYGIELSAPEGRLSLLAVGETLARTTPRPGIQGNWRSTMDESPVSERFAEVATQAATGARDAVVALARYADRHGLPSDSLSRLPLTLLDAQTKALSDNVFNSGIRYVAFLRSLRSA